MSTWIIEGGKLRPSYPECSFIVNRSAAANRPGHKCGGQTSPITFPPWECGTLIERVGGNATECCNDNVELQCESCAMVACELCMEGKWKDR